MNASERPHPWPWTTRDDLAGAFLVNVSDADQALERISVDVDTLGVSCAGECDEAGRDCRQGMLASHRTNMSAVRTER